MDAALTAPMWHRALPQSAQTGATQLLISIPKNGAYGR